jgi:hypothetical protein
MLPKWNDPYLNVGTMIRTALWLVTEIGVGNSFTKEKHRQAFSGVSQADRRLRDLRDYGWVIHTNLEDLTLNSNEQRLVTVGLPVWEHGMRKKNKRESLTAKQRMAIFAENNYQCAVCGIAGGERYPDEPQMTAVLSISRREANIPTRHKESTFVPECKRCRSGAEDAAVDPHLLLADINRLDSADRTAFIRWAKGGRRDPLDRIWADFRRLPAAAQDELKKHLK